MTFTSTPRSALSASILLALASTARAQDFVVSSGTTVVYDTTTQGPLRVERVIIEAGGQLQVVGTERFEVFARQSVRVDGSIDLSGVDSPGVLTLNTANIPEPGARGGPAGATGGVGSARSDRSSPIGGPGETTGLPQRGAEGGETGFGGAPDDAHRGAGGGGGVLALDQPVVADPDDPANLGLVARAGQPGGSTALGARSQSAVPRGGRVGHSPFGDGDPSNDFFGRRIDPVTGVVVVGELAAPLGGRGGAAGGDAIPSASFPSAPFSPSSDEKGASGGGGGGLGIVISPRISVGPAGLVRADGGRGGAGENTNLFNHTGGGSGGGSGGMLVFQARVIDLSAAGSDALSALGGRGGAGADGQFGVRGAGGNGGPGLIQLHVPSAGLRLPAGVGLEALSSPDALVLLLEPTF